VLDPFCHDLYSHYSSASAYFLYPDVLPALRQLKHADYVLGVISDFDERLGDILSQLGILSYMQFVLPSFVVGYSKPSKELYLAAKSRARNVSTESWHIGDDPQKDAFAETQTIILDRNDTISTEYVKIRSLNELSSILH
jgi:putative hydrolase of the HAD superfamily